MKTLGSFLLVKKIDHGGSAEVYLAVDRRAGTVGRAVALKVVRQGMLDGKQAADSLYSEGKLATLLDHTQIVRTYDHRSHGTDHFLVMDYLAGKNLALVLERVSEKRIAIPENIALYVLALVCEGLDYAHTKKDLSGKPLGIVHRDVSPRNVMLTYDGDVKLIDFGLAVEPCDEEVRGLVGNYPYMSPEHVAGQAVEPRSDIFACGALLYELLTGRQLFGADSDFETLERISAARIDDRIDDSGVSISDGIKVILEGCLQRNPDDRFVTANDLREQLIKTLLTEHTPVKKGDLRRLMEDLFAAERAEEALLMAKALEGVATPYPTEEVSSPGVAPNPQQGRAVGLFVFIAVVGGLCGAGLAWLLTDLPVVP